MRNARGPREDRADIRLDQLSPGVVALIGIALGSGITALLLWGFTHL